MNRQARVMASLGGIITLETKMMRLNKKTPFSLFKECAMSLPKPDDDGAGN